jgi:t-SNARE complex subunit (syntaxin)
MSKNEHQQDTWAKSSKHRNSFVDEVRHSDMKGKIFFCLMCMVASIIVLYVIWIYWFS